MKLNTSSNPTKLASLLTFAYASAAYSLYSPPRKRHGGGVKTPKRQHGAFGKRNGRKLARRNTFTHP